MNQIDILRRQLSKLLDWEEGHVNFDTAVDGLPAELQGVRPQGLPYSPWELLEHLRLAQYDILDFCRNPDYKPRPFPSGYWPTTPAPPTADAWQQSAAAVRADREELQRLAADPDLDLFAEVPHGEGQTYLRELLLVADHNAYHIGELVAVRRALGAWK